MATGRLQFGRLCLLTVACVFLGCGGSGDRGGGHARAMAAFLTGVHPNKTDGTDIRNGLSVDHPAAVRFGENTRLASLEVGSEHGAIAGHCDSRYTCPPPPTTSRTPPTHTFP